MTTGSSEFNEVFFDDVFVPDDDVVGPVDGGWTVARATLGNESVSASAAARAACPLPADALIAPLRRAPRAAGRRRRPGRPATSPTHQAMAAAEPAQRPPRRRRRRARPRGQRHQAACCRRTATRRPAILAELDGPDAAFLDGAGAHGAARWC